MRKLIDLAYVQEDLGKRTTFELHYKAFSGQQITGTPSSAESTTPGSFTAEIAVVPWDSTLLGKTVINLKNVKLFEVSEGAENWRLSEALNAHGVFVCCAYAAPQDVEARFFLESEGFHFLEIAYGLKLVNLNGRTDKYPRCSLAPAVAEDLPEIVKLAKTAFKFDRFCMDPRLGPEVSGARYESWVLSSFNNPCHEVMVQRTEGAINGFFIAEPLSKSAVAFRLGAIAPELQGSGLGVLFWNSILRHYQDRGFANAQTQVSSNNQAVLRLWLSLGMQISSSELIYHWVRARG